MNRLKTWQRLPAGWLTAVACTIIALPAVLHFSPNQREPASDFALEPGATHGAPLGLPPLASGAHGDRAIERARLGRKLFFDRRLSFSGSMSCAMCHIPEQGFTTNTSRTSVGMEGKSLRRNAPTLLNVAWQRTLFHDGRELSLATQAWLPLLHPDEMANPSIGYVLERIASLDDYRESFRRAFGETRPTMESVGAAIAAYEDRLASANSRFDRWHFGDESSAITPQEQAGFALFTGKGHCSACHTLGPRHALFSDQQFHNTGIAQRAMTRMPFVVQLAPNVRTRLTEKDLRAFRQAEPPDLGRYEVTLLPADRFAFRTPSLRNVARTAPYMHDGSIMTLAEVIEFYNQGGGPVPGKSPLLRPLGLTADEKASLAAFLATLNGEPTTWELADRPASTGPLTSDSSAVD